MTKKEKLEAIKKAAGRMVYRKSKVKESGKNYSRKNKNWKNNA